MKIIFLDIEGVLNSKSYLNTSYLIPFDPKCLENLQKLVKETNAKIVVSSTWRKSETGRKQLLAILKEYDLANVVVGCTPILDTREKEIDAYLQLTEQLDAFVILDDMKIDNYLPYQVQTDRITGLTEEDVIKAIKILLETKEQF